MTKHQSPHLADANQTTDAKLVELALKVLERAAVLQEFVGTGSIHAMTYLLLQLALVRSICRD
jgi:hypothetical protein